MSPPCTVHRLPQDGLKQPGEPNWPPSTPTTTGPPSGVPPTPGSAPSPPSYSQPPPCQRVRCAFLCGFPGAESTVVYHHVQPQLTLEAEITAGRQEGRDGANSDDLGTVELLGQRSPAPSAEATQVTPELFLQPLCFVSARVGRSEALVRAGFLQPLCCPSLLFVLRCWEGTRASQVRSPWSLAASSDLLPPTRISASFHLRIPVWGHAPARLPQLLGPALYANEPPLPHQLSRAWPPPGRHLRPPAPELRAEVAVVLARVPGSKIMAGDHPTRACVPVWSLAHDQVTVPGLSACDPVAAVLSRAWSGAAEVVTQVRAAPGHRPEPEIAESSAWPGWKASLGRSWSVDPWHLGKKTQVFCGGARL
ncbi:uncharacterized protein LOC117284436 [Fukomys damarensis]|uniref:uncharacterized protein LOC117284436 n=1 Tax=Fukomys damarensis TaxID=885580 RepID=UPI0014555E3D|nr:uncharacterized protein LOC117284436 [Fukomys damarensis]